MSFSARLAFSFLSDYAIVSCAKDRNADFRSRKPTNSTSAESSCAARADAFCRRRFTRRFARQLLPRIAQGFPRCGARRAQGAVAGWAKSERLSARPDSLSRRGDAGDAAGRTRNGDRANARRAARKGRQETTAAIDRLVHYAGWTDKFSQIFSTVNPVASSHFNFTMPEPTGVVVVVCPDDPPLLALVSLVAASDS